MSLNKIRTWLLDRYPVAKRKAFGLPSASERVGLLVFAETEQDIADAKKKVSHWQTHGIEVKSIIYSTKKQLAMADAVLGVKSLNWKGQFKVEHHEEWKEIIFDVCYFTGKQFPMPFGYLLKETQSKIIIGQYLDRAVSYLDICVEGKQTSLLKTVEEMEALYKKLALNGS